MVLAVESICVPDYVATHVLDYQLEEFKQAYAGCSIKGARVVEIGGDFHMVSARLFAANGAAQVITTSLANSFSAKPLPTGVSCEPVDFSKVAVAENSVDLVYGVAVLEHLPDVDAVAQAIDRILAQDGVAHLHGCPLWGGAGRASRLAVREPDRWLRRGGDRSFPPALLL